MAILKILYAGSPLPSAIVLKNLFDAQDDFKIVGVLTNPPNARGRGKFVCESECSVVAKKYGVPVFCPEHLDKIAREKIFPLGANLLVCFDYGKIFGPKFLSLFDTGAINLHPSALPKYRGPTPVPFAILNGERELGISVQKIALKTDEGEILESDFIPLESFCTTQNLLEGDGKSSPVAKKGFELLKKVLIQTAKSQKDEKFFLPPSKPQSGNPSYTTFLKKSDGKIDWRENAFIIERKLRAFTAWPGIFCQKNQRRLKILKAFAIQSEKNFSLPVGSVLPYEKNQGIKILCGENTILVVLELQWEGKSATNSQNFLNGVRDFCGSVLE